MEEVVEEVEEEEVVVEVVAEKVVVVAVEKAVAAEEFAIHVVDSAPAVVSFW